MSVLILSLPLAALGLASSQARESNREQVYRYLRQEFGYTPGEWRRVVAGEAVARSVRAATGQDVPVHGAVRVAGDAGQLVDQIRRIEEFERALKIDEVGRFGDPPRLEDLAGLTILDEDLDALRSCRPGDCPLQLKAATMARFAEQVDWAAADAEERATGIFHETVFDILRSYLDNGVPGLGPYADRDSPTSIPDEMERMYHAQDTPVPTPALTEYLRGYPHAALPGAESLFYWNMGDFGMKPTTRLNHVVIYPVPAETAAETGVRYVIATRQIYANHYFSATLELRTLVEDDVGGTPGFFLLYATRSHVPGLSGLMGALLRPIVRSRARSGMERYLQKTRTVIEESERAGTGRRP
jgi:hypothetical protein